MTACGRGCQQLQEVVQQAGAIATLKRGQAGGEVISVLKIKQGLRQGFERLQGEGLDAGW